MLLGEILAAKGLIEKADIQRALDYQRENGGRFGECLAALGVVSAEQVDEVLQETPDAPRNLDDLDVDSMLLLQLMVKGMYVENFETPSQITDAIRLPNSIVNELLQDAVERKLVEIVGQAQSGSVAFSEMRYQLTRAGRDWATESLELCQYFGPAPVSLESYKDRVNRQRITGEMVSRDQIKEAFSELVIPDRFVDRLGPAINSGAAVLIYGPAGNGKTTIAQIIGRVFNNVIYIPHCFEVDGQIIKVFDPSVHRAINDSVGGSAPASIHRDPLDRRWVPCYRPLVMAGGELTLDMLDLKFSTYSKFYEAPLHVKALNGIFVIDDFGRQRVEPEHILNRWILPLSGHVDYLSLHTGKSFDVPFDELLIFSTNMHPNDLMDPAFQRRIDYKLETVEPSEDLFRKVFENVSKVEGLELTDEIYGQVLDGIRSHGAPLAYYQPRFIVDQVLASCRFEGVPARFTAETVNDALLNLFVRDREESPESPEPQEDTLPLSMRRSA